MSSTLEVSRGIPATETGTETDNPHHARRWLILAVIGLAQLTVVLDTTVVNIALPSAQQALDFTDSQRQWVVTGYSLAFGSLLLLGGRLADLFGRKRVFLTGLVGFAVASAVGGAATSFGMLVAARAVQGGFGALLAPAALSLLTTTFVDAKERVKAFGVYGAIAGGGAAIGLLLGGVLTEYLSWRWTMYVNLVFAAIAFVGGVALLRHRPAEERPRLDLPGVVLVSTALFSLVYGFSHAETDGWANSTTVGFLVASAVLLIAFVWWQTRSAHPLLPLRIFADRNRSGAYTAILISGAGMFGVFLFLTYYLQASLGYSAVMTGVAFMPMVAALMSAAILGNAFIAPRVAPRWTIGGGMLVAALGMVMLTRIGPASDFVGTVLPATLVIGAAVGLVSSAATSLATAGVSSEDAGVSSALVNTGQQVGGSVGTALLNTLFASAVAGYLTSHAADTADVAGRAAIHGYTTAFWISAAIFVGGALLSGALLRGEIVAIERDPTVVAL